MIQQRKKKNSSKVNLIWSVIFHSILILVAFFLAAKGGLIPPRFLPITMLRPEEKKPEPAKEKAPEPKVEPAKAAEPVKTVSVPQPQTQTVAAPPAVDTAPAVAPAATALPAFDFNDGAKEVVTSADPKAIYKALVEHTLRSHWHRPENMADDNFVAEVQLSVDASGALSGYQWMSGSGDASWDATVKAALATTPSISRPPPKDFPAAFVVRFDVESIEGGEAIQLSQR